MFSNYHNLTGRQRDGFTLLELLLVVFILSVLALSAFSLTDTLDSSQDQFRYEAARNQAQKFERAIVDRVEGQAVVGGFVADMGGLPRNMLELAFGLKDGTSAVSAFVPLVARAAVFDGTPYSIYNDGADQVTLEDLTVAKGFRGSLVSNGSVNFYAGAYLDLLPGSAVDYRTAAKSRFDDGWGTTAINGFLTVTNAAGASSVEARSGSDHIVVDDLTHGWAMNVFTSPWAFDNVATGDGAHEIYLKTVGRDNQLDTSPPVAFDYANDVPMVGVVQQSDWATDALDIHIELVNDLPEGSGIQDVALDGTQYGARLLVCNAKLATPLWRQYYSNSFPGVPSNGSRSVAVVDPAVVNPGVDVTRLVPAGKHVLVLNRIVPNPSDPSLPPLHIVDTPLARVIEVADGDTAEERQRIYIPLLKGRNIRLGVDSDNNGSTDYAVSGYHSIAPGDLDTPAKWATLDSTLETQLKDAIDDERGVTDTIVDITCTAIPVLDPSYLVLDVAYELPAGTSQYLNLPRTQVQFDAPGLGDGFQYRGQVVTVLPGQSNVIRLYLSSLFSPFTP